MAVFDKKTFLVIIFSPQKIRWHVMKLYLKKGSDEWVRGERRARTKTKTKRQRQRHAMIMNVSDFRSRRVSERRKESKEREERERKERQQAIEKKAQRVSQHISSLKKAKTEAHGENSIFLWPLWGRAKLWSKKAAVMQCRAQLHFSQGSHKFNRVLYLCLSWSTIPSRLDLPRWRIFWRRERSQLKDNVVSRQRRRCWGKRSGRF